MGQLQLPGMIVGSSAQDATVERAAPNVWWVTLGGDVRPAAFDLPSAWAAGSTVAKIELDTCGAWATVANDGPARPIAVRRAGWVDLRGNPPGAVADDRVGLGPADSLVLWRGAASAQEDVFGCALALAGATPSEIAHDVVAVDGVRDAVVIGVPASLGADPVERVVAATGVDREELDLPGYPLGDLQPDLWRHPPSPPRLARFNLDREAASLAEVRSLLDRLLASWRLDGRIDTEDLKLVATELAANAIVHARAPGSVSVDYLGDRVMVSVTDRSPRQPTLTAAPTDLATSGRGLHLVDALTNSWGVDVGADGKRVWGEIRLAGDG